MITNSSSEEVFAHKLATQDQYFTITSHLCLAVSIVSSRQDFRQPGIHLKRSGCNTDITILVTFHEPNLTEHAEGLSLPALIHSKSQMDIKKG